MIEEKIIPVSKWAEKFSYPTVGSIRQLIFHDTNNFNEKVLRRIGKRLYINIPAFFDWVEETNKQQSA